jgi:peptidoglycan/LPS O-acetylase OafA/YrhL
MTATLQRPTKARPNISKVPYLPGLDGLRAVAVVGVMIYHANKEWLHGGFLGVEVFFVISGYLITLLLIGEHERHGDINLRQFWLRRFRRLLPALFVMMGLVAIYLTFAFAKARGRTRGDFFGGILYGSNWYQIWVGQGYTASEAFVPLRHLWSLAVEEQFYLIWPLVMMAVLRKGRDRLPQVALWLFGAAALVAVAVAVLFYSGDVGACAESSAGYWKIGDRCISINDSLYLGTFGRATGLLLGSAFAMVWRPMAIMRSPLRNRHGVLDAVGVIGLGLTGFLMWKLWLTDFGRESGVRFNPWLFRGGLFLVGIATLMMIAAVTHRRSALGKLLGNPVLNWIGTRSYGLYLYHWPIYQIIRKQAGLALTAGQFIGALTITAALTEASYRLVELPIRTGHLGEWLRGDRPVRSDAEAKRRRNLVLGGVGLAALIGFSTVSVVTAKNECVGDIECSLEQAAEAAAIPPPITNSQPSTSTAPPTTIEQPASTAIGETLPPTTPPTSAVPASTNPPPPPPPVAVGDSVMAGAITPLQAGGFFVNAAESRGGQATAQVVAQLKDAGYIGEIVVIQAGTNSSVSNATYDAIMAPIPPETNVYFLTISAPRDYTAGNNERINALPQRYPNVQVIDWARVAPTLALCSDQIHIACRGGAAQAYANMIFDGIGKPELKG